MNLLVVHNDAAGDRSWDRQRIDRLLAGAGHTAHIIGRNQDWMGGLSDEFDAVVAVGGDGTVHDVVRAAQDRFGGPIAILPIGTANNLAYALGYSAADAFADRIAAWPDSERLLQIGNVETNAGRCSLLECVGAGAFAEMTRVSEGGDSAPAIALLMIRKKLLEILLTAEPHEATIDIDGEHMAGRFLMLEIMNIPYFGPRIALAPGESSDESMVSVCAVREADREAAAQWISTSVGDVDRYLLGRGSHVEITTDEWVHVDGESWPGHHSPAGTLRVDAGARAVRMWV